MKACPNCNNQQESGKFCGKCGSEIQDVTTMPESTLESAASQQQQPNPVPPVQQYAQTAPQPASPPAQPNEQVEKLRNESKQFFNSFMQQLKNPSTHFDQVQDGMKNNLISLIVYILLTGLSVSMGINSMLSFGLGLFEPSKTGIILFTGLLSAVLLAIGVTAIFITSKFFSEEVSYGEVIRKVTGYLAPAVALSAASLLLALANSTSISMLLVALSMILAFFAAPTFVMAKLISRQAKSIDSYYAFLVYLSIVSISIYLIVHYFVSSIISDMTDSLDMFF